MSIGVAGIAGRMGRLVAEEILAAGADLAGGTCLPDDVPQAGVSRFTDISSLAAAARVVVDFTHPLSVPDHAACLSAAGTAWVLGTTGLSADDQHDVATAARRIAIVQAANFSPGVNFILGLAERLAAALPADAYDAEIVEMHHRQKIDAPSGTAIAIGQAVARGRGVDFDAVKVSGRDGQTGARPVGAIGLSALRGGQVVGEHTLLFAAGDEHIAITHRAFDRRSFARGAVRAALWLRGKPPGLYSMIDVLGLELAALEAGT
jgi:4-hydroxy-tetrahydrodipicolinate reductase